MRNLKILTALFAFTLLFTSCEKKDTDELITIDNQIVLNGTLSSIQSAGINLPTGDNPRYWFVLSPDIITDNFESEPLQYISFAVDSESFGERVDLKSNSEYWWYMHAYLNNRDDYISAKIEEKDQLISGHMFVEKEVDHFIIVFSVELMSGDEKVEFGWHYSGTPEVIDLNSSPNH